MSKIFKTEGIVLKRHNFGEADRLLTLYTRECGKITVIARGIRKITSKKAPHLELFHIIQATIASGKSLGIITEIQLLHAFSVLSHHLERIAYAYKIVEVIDALAPIGQINSSIYRLLFQALQQLNEDKLIDSKKITERFILEVLWEFGYLEAKRELKEEILARYIEHIIERSLKSDNLLTKIRGSV